MALDRNRDRIIKLINEMRSHTVDRGCTPAEAAGFAAKAAEWMEKYQVDEAELRAQRGEDPEVETVQNKLRTGKKVFNPGMNAVVNSLAIAMCCKCILLRERDEAVYGLVGDTLDVDYVCQIATTVVPSLQMMATLEGREHGHEKAGLVRWSNQYLTGAAQEIQARIESERKARADIKQIEHDTQVANGCTALAVITGETLAVQKRMMVAEAFKQLYPRVKQTRSRSQFDGTAHERGREAGKTVGLRIGVN